MPPSKSRSARPSSVSVGKPPRKSEKISQTVPSRPKIFVPYTKRTGPAKIDVVKNSVPRKIIPGISMQPIPVSQRSGPAKIHPFHPPQIIRQKMLYTVADSQHKILYISYDLKSAEDYKATKGDDVHVREIEIEKEIHWN